MEQRYVDNKQNKKRGSLGSGIEKEGDYVCKSSKRSVEVREGR